MPAERDDILERAVAAFKREGAAAVHLFGSLARGDGDHLSDVDLWITVPDDKIHTLVARRFEIFGSIADILIYHEAPRNRPLGGSYTLVIHCIGDVLIQCDYYLAPESTSVILPEARRLSGSQALPRGPWTLDKDAVVTEDRRERIDFLICMSFIGIKKVLRGDDDFHSLPQSRVRALLRDHLSGASSTHFDSALDDCLQLWVRWSTCQTAAEVRYRWQYSLTQGDRRGWQRAVIHAAQTGSSPAQS